MIMALLPMALAVLLLAGTAAAPHARDQPAQLYGVQNWQKGGGGPLGLKWSAYRLVAIDASTGAVTGQPTAGSHEQGWHGGLLPNHDDPLGTLVGGAYSATESERRDSVLVDLGGAGSLECFNATSHTPCAPVAAVKAGLWDEVDGFFSTVTMDDVQPYNTIFSLYDALTLGQPSHFATINASTLVGELYTSHGGNSEATQVNFVAAVPLGGGGAAQQEPQQQLWRVDRISGHVSRVPFPLGANRSQAVRGLFVVPASAAGGAAEKATTVVLVLMCVESFVHDCTLYAQDTNDAPSPARVLLHLPGLDPGSSVSNCKSWHPPTLYLGCESIHAIKLDGDREATLVGVINVSVADGGGVFHGGEFSMGGIVAM
jgi:hypothetical protein